MDKNNNKPKLRFPGFTDDWEQRKLGDAGETFTGLSGKTKDDFGHGNARFITYMNVFSNPVSDLNGVDAIEIDSKQSEVKYGDVLFTTSSETPDEVGMASVWLENSANTYLNSFCFGYRPTEKFNSYYLAYMLRSPSIRKNFKLLAQGISRYNISKNKTMEMEIYIPSNGEQRLVGNFFRSIDNLITLHQRKLNHLKDKKKGLLQKMFPKKGEDFPELRFPGFTDPWEQRKLGEITETITKGTTPIDKNWVGPVNYIKTESIDKESGNLTNTSNTSLEEHEGFLKRSQLKSNDVLFSIVGTLGRVGLVKSKDLPANTNQQIAIIRLKEINPYFAMNALKTPCSKSFITSETTIGAQPSLSLWQINKMEIGIPFIAEQNQIGTFFSNLDNLITLHQRKLKHLQEQKKALLQQMFV